MTLRGLYAITDSQLLAGKLLPYVEAALDGGLTLLQYRDKSNDDARRLREAQALLDLCQRYKAHLIINDDAELAARLGVGVHLGQTDGPLTPARALLGSQAIIGSTCHSQLELAEQAAKRDALLRMFEASGKTVAEFADMYGMNPDDVIYAVERSRANQEALSAQAAAQAEAEAEATANAPESTPEETAEVSEAPATPTDASKAP